MKQSYFELCIPSRPDMLHDTETKQGISKSTVNLSGDVHLAFRCGPGQCDIFIVAGVVLIHPHHALPVDGQNGGSGGRQPHCRY